MKTCTKCKVEKDVGSFHTHKQKKDGLNSWCKQCVIEYRRDYRKKNKEKEKDYRKKKQRKNKSLLQKISRRKQRKN